jgi:hypothetical protein
MPNGTSSETVSELDVPTYLPLSEVARKFNLSENVLTQLIQAGKIEAVRLPSGELLVSAENGKPKTREMIINESYLHLKGNPITITEAAKKYELPRSTIEKWLERQYIEIVDPDSYPMKVDEADVSYCVDVYRQRKALGITGGVPLLDEEGLPYQLKHPDLSKRRRMQRIIDK